MRTSAWLGLIVLVVSCGGAPATASPTPELRTPGPLGDTWVLSASHWQRVEGAGPTPRYAGALAYDPTRHWYVLFGGQSASTSLDDTWLYDGRTWKHVHPAHQPSARRAAAMAYDPKRQLVVLYGGLVQDHGEGHPASDTWTWDGIDWQMMQDSGASPGPRFGSEMTSSSDGVLLFGGSEFKNDGFYADAWRWDGVQWARVDRGPTPPARSFAALAWVDADSSLFVYGGSGLNPDASGGANGTPLSDAWALKGGKWQQILTSGPAARAQANAMLDGSHRDVLIMFGMTGTRCPDPTNEVWAWDGNSWSHRPNAVVPARWGAALAQAGDGSALVFGGSDEPGC